MTMILGCPVAGNGKRCLYRIASFVVLAVLAPAGASAAVTEPCVATPRLPANPTFQAQEEAFGFHDEELVLCSDGGGGNAIHIAARLWVPKGCLRVGGCAGVVIAKGSKLMLSITPSDVTIALPARGIDPFYVNHTMAAPSSITLPLAPVSRTPPSGNPPTGASFTDDPVGTLCTASGLPC